MMISKQRFLAELSKAGIVDVTYIPPHQNGIRAAFGYDKGSLVNVRYYDTHEWPKRADEPWRVSFHGEPALGPDLTTALHRAWECARKAATPPRDCQ
jgi:hypothetical protein